METIRVFAGFDRREEVGYHTFVSSIIHNTSLPTTVLPLIKEKLENLGIHLAEGSNGFTYSRFLPPYICNFKGWALFMDASDMIVKGDLAHLWEQRDARFAVQVVKHDYKTRHPRKYIGTEMECENRNYARKQWAAVMLMNCEHEAWADVTPEIVAMRTPMDLLQLKFIKDEWIGELPIEWNWLCDEHGRNDLARVLHFTAGVPAFPVYGRGDHADEWFGHACRAMSATGGAASLGQSPNLLGAVH